jgi:hypothetical protein
MLGNYRCVLSPSTECKEINESVFAFKTVASGV